MESSEVGSERRAWNSWLPSGRDLRGAPASAIEEIIVDYTAHFDEGVAANRAKSDIAAALGDPYALADELRMELRIEAFESAPSPRSAAKVVADAVALGMINIVLLCVAVPFLACRGFHLDARDPCVCRRRRLASRRRRDARIPGGIATTVLCASGLDLCGGVARRRSSCFPESAGQRHRPIRAASLPISSSRH